MFEDIVWELLDNIFLIILFNKSKSVLLYLDIRLQVSQCFKVPKVIKTNTI